MTMYSGHEALRDFWAELGVRMIKENRLFYIRFEKGERTFLAYRINSTKDGLMKDFTSRRKMLWVRSTDKNYKFTATKDVL